MLLSVITINYNNAAGLKKTIESIVQQKFTNFEYIVIDGGSTDGSGEIVRQYQQHITYWISEPDNGIYHAMNKGVKQARGEYLLMINSGDFLVDDMVFDTVFKTNATKQIIYGDIRWNEDGRKYEEAFTSRLTFDFFRTRSIGHQAAFIHRSVHEIVGLYDENYKIISDWKLLTLAICKYNLSYEHIPFIVAECDRDGISCKPENLGMIDTERQEILQKEFSAYLYDYKELDLVKRELYLLNLTLVVRVYKKLNRLFKINRYPNG